MGGFGGVDLMVVGGWGWFGEIDVCVSRRKNVCVVFEVAQVKVYAECGVMVVRFLGCWLSSVGWGLIRNANICKKNEIQ